MKEVVAKKEMDDPQRKILGFMKKHKGHYYSIREFAYFTKCTEAQVKETLKSFDASEYGGAPLLGLKGLVVKAHGSSKANEIKNSLIQCITFSKEDICGKIQENMKQDNKGDN